MKKLFLAAASTFLVGQATYASVFFSDDFNSYANGNLVGQGSWQQTGAVNTTPVQVNNGTAVLGTGQDVYAPLNAPIPLTDGTSFYIGLDVDITSAQATGDYFLHFTPSVGNASLFGERFYAKSSGAGFVFGYDGSSGGTINYSSTVLTLNQDYRVVLEYTSVAGSANDTFTLYVNPADTTTEGNNTPYMTSGYVGTGNELTNALAINFRQGGASSAPGVIADNLDVANTFGEAATFTSAPVPEPAVIVLFGLGGLGLLVRRKITA